MTSLRVTTEITKMSKYIYKSWPLLPYRCSENFKSNLKKHRKKRGVDYPCVTRYMSFIERNNFQSWCTVILHLFSISVSFTIFYEQLIHYNIIYFFCIQYKISIVYLTYTNRCMVQFFQTTQISLFCNHYFILFFICQICERFY